MRYHYFRRHSHRSFYDAGGDLQNKRRLFSWFNSRPDLSKTERETMNRAGNSYLSFISWKTSVKCVNSFVNIIHPYEWLRPFTATHCYNRLPNLIFTFLIPHIQTTVDKTDFCQGFPYFNYICFLASVQIQHRLMPAVPDYLQKILLWHRCYKISLSVYQNSILERYFRSPLFLLLSNVWHFCDINAITQLFLLKIYIDRRGILCYIIYQKGW